MHHESGFKKYAVSSADARGYMQVMPFWTRLIGGNEHNLFHLRTNLRYGCVILRHYLDRESGDLFRALGRYNGSLGRANIRRRRGGDAPVRIAIGVDGAESRCPSRSAPPFPASYPVRAA